jgi:hypothetical protein
MHTLSILGGIWKKKPFKSGVNSETRISEIKDLKGFVIFVKHSFFTKNFKPDHYEAALYQLFSY